MSILTVGNITGVDNQIQVQSGFTFVQPGATIQTLYYRTDNRSVYSAPATGNGTTVTDLNMTITPKKANSLLLLRWAIRGEIHYNSVFTLHQNGQLIIDPGYQGYNNQAGNSRWSGVVTPLYDAEDQSSTPFSVFLQYAIPAGSTVTRTYAPAIRSSSATAYTLYLNRTVASAGADAYEVMISTGIVMEIAQ